MAGNPKYDGGKIEYNKTYYSIMPDPAIMPAFTPQGKVKLEERDDGDGGKVKVPVIAETLTLVKIGQFREPSEKVDRPVFQMTQMHAYTTADLARFRKNTIAKDVKTVETNGAPAPQTDTVAGF